MDSFLRFCVAFPFAYIVCFPISLPRGWVLCCSQEVKKKSMIPQIKKSIYNVAKKKERKHSTEKTDIKVYQVREKGSCEVLCKKKRKKTF